MQPGVLGRWSRTTKIGCRRGVARSRKARDGTVACGRRRARAGQDVRFEDRRSLLGRRSAPAGVGTPFGRCSDRYSRLAQIFVLWWSLTLPAEIPTPACARTSVGIESFAVCPPHCALLAARAHANRGSRSSPVGRRRAPGLPERASVPATGLRPPLRESSAQCSARREPRCPPEPSAALHRDQWLRGMLRAGGGLSGDARHAQAVPVAGKEQMFMGRGG